MLPLATPHTERATTPNLSATLSEKGDESDVTPRLSWLQFCQGGVTRAGHASSLVKGLTDSSRLRRFLLGVRESLGGALNSPGELNSPVRKGLIKGLMATPSPNSAEPYQRRPSSTAPAGSPPLHPTDNS
eukprot:8020728-Pyramimonas_sp.AAC.1